MGISMGAGLPIDENGKVILEYIDDRWLLSVTGVPSWASELLTLNYKMHFRWMRDNLKPESSGMDNSKEMAFRISDYYTWPRIVPFNGGSISGQISRISFVDSSTKIDITDWIEDIFRDVRNCYQGTESHYIDYGYWFLTHYFGLLIDNTFFAISDPFIIHSHYSPEIETWNYYEVDEQGIIHLYN